MVVDITTLVFAKDAEKVGEECWTLTFKNQSNGGRTSWWNETKIVIALTRLLKISYSARVDRRLFHVEPIIGSPVVARVPNTVKNVRQALPHDPLKPLKVSNLC